MTDGCGMPLGGPSLEGVDLTKATIVQGTVTHGGEPVTRAYVQLLDIEGEFVAEVITDPEGHYRFFAKPGAWTLSVMHRLGRARIGVDLAGGGVTTHPLSLG
jgi:hypothetical protein